jgi:hypothetical protein
MNEMYSSESISGPSVDSRGGTLEHCHIIQPADEDVVSQINYAAPFSEINTYCSGQTFSAADGCQNRLKFDLIMNHAMGS